MRRIGLCLLLLLAILASPGAQAQSRALTVNLAQNHVDITTGFTGAELVLYGMKTQPGDIAVVIRGPKKTMVVRRKGQVFGMWMNRQSIDFSNVPSYYDLALSRPEYEIARADIMIKNGIGLDTLDFVPSDNSDPESVATFKEALIRTQQGRGLFPLKPREITFLNENFFRVNFYVPSNVPTGDYTVKTYLLQEGRILESKSLSLRVGQVGFGARVYRYAHTKSLAYGLAAVLFAVTAGWAASTFLRRD